MTNPTTVDPEAQGILDAMAAATSKAPANATPTTDERVAAGRAAYLGAIPMAGPPEPVASVEDRIVDGRDGPVPIRIYRATADEGPTPVLVWLHGGSFVSGDLETHDAPLRAITNRSGHATIAVAWRLAPEHPFPAGLEDARAVLEWIASGDDARFDATRIAIGGDSAGGALAAVTTRRARDRGGPAIAAQVLVYPNTDLAGDGRAYPSWAENEGRVLTRREMEADVALYAGAADRASPDLSPLHGDVGGLPRTLVVTGEADPLRDEGEAYVDRLRAAGVAVDHTRYPGMIHGFLQMAGALGAGRALIDEIGAWVAGDGRGRGRRRATLLVVGATGPTGREIVTQALARGHRVRALVHRDDEGDSMDSPDVDRIVGDVLDADAMRRAVDGVDAVLSALGSKVSLLHEVTLLSEGTRHLVDAMEARGVRRLIAITGIGAGDSRGHGGFVYDQLVEPLVLRHVYEDKDRQEDVIRASRLDWTIVRPAQLRDGAPKHGYRALTDLTGVTATTIAHGDVAHFVLEALERDAWIGQTPLITD